MTDDWRERLRSLRDRFTGKSREQRIEEVPRWTPSAEKSDPPFNRASVAPAAANHPATARTAETVAINLGIDFGTSFTKVCFRDVGTEESSVIPFERSALGSALIPTIVAIGDGGRLYVGDRVPRDTPVVMVPYLKMRLAGQRLGDDLQAVDGIDLNGVEATRALSSWLLASIVKRSQEWIRRNERNRKSRTPVWSANIGVPVAYCDSHAIHIFDEVLGVAWIWLKSGSVPQTLSQALVAYERGMSRLRDQPIDFHAVPEIAAAVHSFVISRESVTGIYVYFDIGGGTMDGVAFELVNIAGTRRINFYSGKVEPLGISAFASALGAAAADDGRPDLVDRLLESASSFTTEGFARRVRQLVGYVIVTAKRKDRRDWQRDAFRGSAFERKFIGSLEPSRMVPLIVFLGGGGAPSAWYRSVIASTYHEFRHHKAGIPPYKLIEVPKPSDLSMRGLPDAEFRRFAISYGLSIPFGEAPDVGLPSRFAVAEKLKARTVPGGVDYADSKDVYD